MADAVTEGQAREMIRAAHDRFGAELEHAAEQVRAGAPVDLRAAKDELEAAQAGVAAISRPLGELIAETSATDVGFRAGVQDAAAAMRLTLSFRAERVRQGMSLEDAARKVDRSAEVLDHLERGVTDATAAFLLRYARVLGGRFEAGFRPGREASGG